MKTNNKTKQHRNG